MSTSQDASIAWAAGLFEGEGFIVRREAGKRIYVEIGLQTCDLDVLERFVSILRDHGIAPAERTNGPRKRSEITARRRREAHHKQAFSWKTTGNTGIAAFQLLRPQLGARRRQTGDAIIAESQAVLAERFAPVQCKQCGNDFMRGNYAARKRFCGPQCYGRWLRSQPAYREASLERNRKYRAKPEVRAKLRERDRNWYANNPEKAAEKNRKRRERRRAQRQKLGDPLRTC